MIRTFVPGGSVCLVGVLPHLLTAPARSVYSYLLLLLILILLLMYNLQILEFYICTALFVHVHVGFTALKTK